MKRESIAFFLILLAFLVLGYLVGQSVGTTQCNKHYQSPEIQKEIHENYVLQEKEKNLEIANIFDFPQI